MTIHPPPQLSWDSNTVRDGILLKMHEKSISTPEEMDLETRRDGVRDISEYVASYFSNCTTEDMCRFALVRGVGEIMKVKIDESTEDSDERSNRYHEYVFNRPGIREMNFDKEVCTHEDIVKRTLHHINLENIVKESMSGYDITLYHDLKYDDVDGKYWEDISVDSEERKEYDAAKGQLPDCLLTMAQFTGIPIGYTPIEAYKEVMRLIDENITTDITLLVHSF
jgi:hypothetical protein